MTVSTPPRDSDGQPVEVSLRVSAGELVGDLTVWAPPAATTGEVVDALTAFLGLTPQQLPRQSPGRAANGARHAFVDGVQLSGASLWGDVAPCTGSVVHLGQDHSPATPGTSRWELAVVSGTLAGTRLPLRAHLRHRMCNPVQTPFRDRASAKVPRLAPVHRSRAGSTGPSRLTRRARSRRSMPSSML